LKKNLQKVVFLVLALFCLNLRGNAQAFENVGDYMSYISKASENITVMYLSYLSALGHNKSAKKIDKRRQEVINTIFNTRVDIQGMPPWKGDRSYRDSTVSYLKLLYNVFNEDYAKIVDMEEIAEQSYDAMEAYMLAQEKANQKLALAGSMQQVTQKEFGLKYNVKILQNTSELEMKSQQASALMNHYGEVYLAFFKPYKQEAYLMDAIARKDLTAIEQNKNALGTTSQEGLEKLKAMKGYNNDPSLVVACRDALNFFIAESKQMQLATDYLLKETAFLKMKKNFDSKPASQRTQKDVDEYNAGINEINKASNDYNNGNNALNNQRNKVVGNWDKTVKNYLDNYMPFQRK
jgi:hypothetical protein